MRKPANAAHLALEGSSNQLLMQRQFCGWMAMLIVMMTPWQILGQFESMTTADGSGIVITGYYGPGGAVSIPLMIGGLPVTEIKGFSGRRDVTSVIISDSVLKVDAFAFADCAALGCVSIGQQVNSIVLPGDVPQLDSPSFSGCLSLTNFTVHTLNTKYRSQDGVLFDASSHSLLQFPYGRSGNYAVPAGARNVFRRAFRGCNKLVRVRIPDTVTNIESAFTECAALVSATIGNGVDSCGGANAFQITPALERVYFTGNAPRGQCTSSFFDDSSTNLVVYYLPERSGWTATFEGRSACLWNPRFQPAMTENGFGWLITGSPGIAVQLESTMDLVNPSWSSIGSFIIPKGGAFFHDPERLLYAHRYFRVSGP